MDGAKAGATKSRKRRVDGFVEVDLHDRYLPFRNYKGSTQSQFQNSVNVMNL